MKHYEHVNAVINALSVEDDVPISFKEIIRNSNSEIWLAVIKEEMKSLQRKQTWDLVPLPAGRIGIGRKWVYKKKEDSSELAGTKYNARLVAKGYVQKE